VFETFRPVVLGARLVAITGKLQNERGVIHVVANHIEDLTPLLRRFSEPDLNAANGEIEAGSRPLKGAHPRRGDSLVRLLREQPDIAEELLSTHQVMPKGRNFH
jgi:error-prone DNA polymerase